MGARTTGYPQAKEWSWTLPHTTYKINSKCNEDLTDWKVMVSWPFVYLFWYSTKKDIQRANKHNTFKSSATKEM